jgi:hypothetical protein
MGRSVEMLASPRYWLKRKLNPAFARQSRQAVTWLLAVCAIACCTSCSSTKVRGSKTAAGLSISPFQSVAVVVVDDRQQVRAQFEGDVVHFLQERKVVGVGASERFTLSDFKGDATQIQQKCASAGTESLLLVRTVDRSTFERGPSFERSAGFGEIETEVQLGATLYRVSDGVPIWNGAISTILKDQYSPGAVLTRVAKAIVNNLAKDKVIP